VVPCDIVGLGCGSWRKSLSERGSLSFGIGSMMLGGDAYYGHSDGGHYFLGSHGRMTEVSRAVFLYSYWHVHIMLWTWPFGVLASLTLAVMNHRGRSWRMRPPSDMR
jgi:hypothetical protein